MSDPVLYQRQEQVGLDLDAPYLDPVGVEGFSHNMHSMKITMNMKGPVEFLDVLYEYF